jgi:lysozyme
MDHPINPTVIDLSHWGPASDYGAVKAARYVGVIYKATQGQFYIDPTYVQQQQAAKAAGLKWGAYHFGDSTDTDGQIDNFCNFAVSRPRRTLLS